LRKWQKAREPPVMISRLKDRIPETNSNGCKGKGEKEMLIETVRILNMEVQSYKEDNERLMREKIQINAQVLHILNQFQRKTKKGSNSRQEEEGRCHERRDYHGRVGYSRSASRARGHHSPPYSERNFYALDDPIRSLEVFHVKHQRRKQ
jgi:FtsZ-binding cell division protein ZapB